MALPQVIQQPPKPGALIRPPQVTLTQTPMVALRQPHNRIVLTTPQQIQLNPLQPGEAVVLGCSLRSCPPIFSLFWDTRSKIDPFSHGGVHVSGTNDLHSVGPHPSG